MTTRRRVLVGGITIVVVVAAASSAVALTSGSGASYRFATVGRGTVAQSVVTTGAISPISSADVDFQVAGTVGRVLVTQGQTVRAGEKLAVLDRTSLRSALTAAESTLANARSSLTSDEDSETSSTTTTTDAAASTSTTSTTVVATPTPTATASSPATQGSGSAGGTSRQVAKDQAALIAAQHQADDDLATARTALAAETAACASELSGATTTTETCTEATKALLADQETVSSDQNAVAKAEDALDHDLAKASTSTASSASSATGTGTGTGTGSSSHGATATTPSSSTTGTSGSHQSSGAASGQSATARTVTAAELAGDQATIDSDRAAVATARASLDQATVTSPIAGRVVAVTIAKGDTVSGSSSSTSPALEIVGSKQSEVTIDLTAAQVRSVKVGMVAHVVADGTSTTVAGTVTSIGLTTSSSDSSTYPVVIALSSRATSLVSGADAAVTLDLASVDDVVSVPTSAVHRNGTKAYVEVVRNGTLTHVTVAVGAVGATLTQITSGAQVGQRVVLANLSAAVPSSSTNLTTTTRRGLTGSTRFGGAGGTGGGFTGGGFTGGGFTGGPPTGGFGGG